MQDRNSVEDDKANDSEDFATLLESYGGDIDGSVQVGDKINARIIAIGSDTVFVETGTKIDGLVEKKELLDDKGQLPYGVLATGSSFPSLPQTKARSGFPGPCQVSVVCSC
ncbi:MAG: hypothetical protein U5R30_18460 [Deltaproteobacteria bacterium]|nr:hypothetical protein [Deltaproteobacteria bacterium]